LRGLASFIPKPLSCTSVSSSGKRCDVARPASSSSHEPSSTIRQLKLLVVVLVLSNIGLGIFGFYLLRSVDRTYSDLIDQSVPVLNDLQTLTALAVSGMRGTNPRLFTDTGGNREEIIEASRAALANDRALRNKLLQVEWVTGENAERAHFRVAGEAFSRTATQVLADYAAGEDPIGVRRRDDQLRPEFDRYLSAITRAADVLQAESSRQNSSLSARAGSVSTMVPGIASWPVILLLGLLTLTAIFVLVLMMLFRGREMNGLPSAVGEAGAPPPGADGRAV
jgi:hypothetical protein